jgi:hypothetical protein
MDAIVEAALRKWPGVPDVDGWLGLDARGQWWLRDAATQAQGPFPQVRGSRIEHAGLLGLIGRNYAAAADGAWYFQNGPQRVWVDLEATPWVWRLHGDAATAALVMLSHTGVPASARSLWLDEAGRLYVDTDLGFGLVHTLDTALAAQAIERGHWPPPQETLSTGLPARFGYRRRRAGG